ncbi:MAG: tandem-95 repeat protein, partial [Gammaproteobacteria bacterium]|nr:tandem-95 repeat protein [Gammaproteobacteria bacterium]
TIDVTSVNDAPVATDAARVVLEDDSVIIDLRNSATDVDNDQASLIGQIVAAPLHGQLTLNGDGTFTYAPVTDFNGVDTFTYTVNDGELDSNTATVTISVTSVNDAPTGADNTVTTLEDTAYVFQVADFGFTDSSDNPANAFTAVFVDSLPAAGALTVNGAAVIAGQSVSVTDIAAGLLQFNPAADANGAGYANFTFRVQDDGGIENGGIDTDPTARTLVIDVTPVNDAPVAADSTVVGQEDTPYIFAWSDFQVTDIDTNDLAIIINALPLNGLLQHFNGVDWLAVNVGQIIIQADIEAGYLTFGPDTNESGYDGYATAGAGNLLQDYASFSYQGYDGELLSSQVSMTVDITPVADLPALMFTNPPDQYGATADVIQTSWESAANRNKNSTVLPQMELEGWQAVLPEGDSNNHFIVWSNGDKMKDSNNTKRTVYGSAEGGNNWIEISDAQGSGHETFGIEREFMTRAGTSYTLNLDYAGHLGYGVEYTRIGFYVDGVQIGTYANTSSANALNWQEVGFSFVGTGANQTIGIVTEATATQSNGRGAMIDNIRLKELLAVSTGYQDVPIRLSTIVSSLHDLDGSESLSLTIGAVPVGANITDGNSNFTASAGVTEIDVTGWDLTNLMLMPATGFVGSFDLLVAAHATEAGTGEVSTHALPLTVTVLADDLVSPIVLDLNGDGVQTVALDPNGGKFDLLNTGEAINSGWLSREDGFLAMDANNNGKIDNQSELFGGMIGEGYAKLKALDENLDGVIDEKDRAYANLSVWQDINGNHRTDSGELGSLKEHGIASLSVNYTIQPE